MISNPFLLFVLQLSLFALVLMLLVSAWRIIKGPRIADRIIGIDLVTAILVGIMLILAIIEGQALLIDVALSLAALNFVGTLAITRFVAEGRVF